MIQKRMIFVGLGLWGGIGVPASALALVVSIAVSAGLLVVASVVMFVLSVIAGSLAWGWDQNRSLPNPEPLRQKTLKPKKMDNDEYTRFMEWQALGTPGHKELG